jgi:uncharacterized 2Fe-2S/4Fe-4S cluster protein (DUF4445 family)
MMPDKIPVKFLPSGKTAHVPAGCTLLQAAGMAGVWIDAPCSGNQRCGKCRVRVVEGEAHAVSGTQRLSMDEMLKGWTLACAVRVVAPLTVEVPGDAGAESSGVLSRILVEGEAVRVRHDKRNRGHLGVAVDLGTTSVAAALFDLFAGEERACVATHNGQIKFGDDVISRIAHARGHPDGLRDLQECAVRTLNSLIRELCDLCGESSDAIFHVTVAGNTTMQQTLIGLDPSPLGEYPFTPAFRESCSLAARTVGLETAAEATLVVFPQIGGFVGGDTVAGVLAAGFDRQEKPTLFVDIGTNGEIALLHGGVIYAASAAAGPAFEGARIYHGMRAREGAVDQIWQTGDALHCHTIGSRPPEGICGSALIDCIALMLEEGLVESGGRMLRHGEWHGRHAGRLFDDPGGEPCFALVCAPDGAPKVWLTQRDVRELQLASGTIRAGIETLLRMAGITAGELDAIVLAGGFGNVIRREKALAIGMLPQVHFTKIRFAGNASLTGAKRGLLAQSEMKRAAQILHMARHVDLSAQPGFSDLFMEHMLFPERL